MLLGQLRQGAAKDHFQDFLFIFEGPSQIADRAGDVANLSSGALDDLGRQPLATEHVLDRRRFYGTFARAAQADADVATDPIFVDIRLHRHARHRKVAGHSFQFYVPPQSWPARDWNRDFPDQLVGLKNGRVGECIKIRCLDFALAARAQTAQPSVEGQDYRSPVPRGIRFHDSAGGGSQVSHLQVAEQAYGFAHHWNFLADQRRAFDVRVPGQCPDHQATFALFDITQSGDAIEVDQVFRPRQAQFHQWDQALTTGKNPCVFATLSQKIHGFLQTLWLQILESNRIHPKPPSTPYQMIIKTVFSKNHAPSR